MSKIEEMGMFNLSDFMNLLNKVLYALEKLPEQRIPGNEGWTTSELAGEIKLLLTGEQDG